MSTKPAPDPSVGTLRLDQAPVVADAPLPVASLQPLKPSAPNGGDSGNSEPVGTPPSADDQTPRERACRALTVLLHETGTATVSLSGLTLADVQVDLETRVADAIADAEDAAERRLTAELTRLRAERDQLVRDKQASSPPGEIEKQAEIISLRGTEPPMFKRVVIGEPLRCGYCGEKALTFYSFNPDVEPDMCHACVEIASSAPVPIKGLTPDPSVGTPPQPRTGVKLIAAERQRQIDAEGWTLRHDDTHDGCQMLLAAENYLAIGRFIALTGRTDGETFYHGLPPKAGLWPWHPDWWKPTYDDPIRNLVKAAALIAAEIDRLQRKASGESK